MEENFKLPLSGKKGKGKFAIVPAPLRAELLKNKWWCDNSKGYAVGQVNGKKTFLHKRVYELLAKRGLRPALDENYCQVDHANRTPLDNSFNNLRPATFSTNNQNQAKRKHSKSTTQQCLYKGVSYNCSQSTWRAIFKNVHLGTHKDPLICAFWFDHAVFLDGQDGLTNFPEPNPSYPLKPAAKARLMTRFAMSADCKERCVYPAADGSFRVNVSRQQICTAPTLEEAVIFRDLAKEKGATHARELFAQIYL